MTSINDALYDLQQFRQTLEDLETLHRHDASGLFDDWSKLILGMFPSLNEHLRPYGFLFEYLGARRLVKHKVAPTLAVSASLVSDDGSKKESVPTLNLSINKRSGRVVAAAEGFHERLVLTSIVKPEYNILESLLLDYAVFFIKKRMNEIFEHTHAPKDF